MPKNPFEKPGRQKSAWLKFGSCVFFAVTLTYALLTGKATAIVIGFVLLGLGFSLDGPADLLLQQWPAVTRIVQILRVVCILGALLLFAANLLAP